MLDSDDIYDDFWPAFTEDDLERIDYICAERSQSDAQISIGASHSQDIQSDSDTLKHALKETNKVQATTEGLAFLRQQQQCLQSACSPPAQVSPLSQFRSRGYLSVLDVVSPAWCEVQFDYGLRQLRKMPVEKRPTKFVTEKGKEIVVNKATAIKNDKVQKRGQAIHKVLEKQVHKEVVVLEVKSREDTWASRLFDFLVRLQVLKDDNICRELPIWGILQDQPIFGVIDELRLVHADRKNKIDSKQKQLDSFVVKSNPNTCVGSNFKIEISDSKTRAQPDLPSHSNTLPSRLQLMVYHRLLHDVLAPSPASDVSFTSFCARIGLQVHQSFSPLFINEIARLVVENGLSYHFLDATCISDLEAPFRETIRKSGFDSPKLISKRLTLTYRLRGRDSHSKKRKVSLSQDTFKSKSDESAPVTPGLGVTSLIENLLAEEGFPAAPSKPISVEVPSSEASLDASHQETSVRNQPEIKTKRRSTPEPSESDDEAQDGAKSTRIIGTKVFNYNIVLLEAHLANVLDWWQGKRPPRGVELEETGRCRKASFLDGFISKTDIDVRSCEYLDGCEWREQKAQEMRGNQVTASHEAF